MYQLSEYNIFQTQARLAAIFPVDFFWPFFTTFVAFDFPGRDVGILPLFDPQQLKSLYTYSCFRIWNFLIENMTSCTAFLCILCACFLHYNCIWNRCKSVYLILISLQSFYIQSLYILREKHNKFGDAASLSYVVVVLHWISFRKEASRHYSVLNPCVLLHSSSISFDYSGQH